MYIPERMQWYLAGRECEKQCFFGAHHARTLAVPIVSWGADFGFSHRYLLVASLCSEESSQSPDWRNYYFRPFPIENKAPAPTPPDAVSHIIDMPAL